MKPKLQDRNDFQFINGEIMHHTLKPIEITCGKLSIVIILIILLTPLSNSPAQPPSPTAIWNVTRSAPAANLTSEDAEVVYAMITHANFTKDLAPLVDWKTQKGVPAKVYELGWIYDNYNGSDAQEQLHNFLADLDRTSKNLTWALLVGDTEIIPIREFYLNASLQYGLDDLYASDYYYAGLDSDWDSDNDGVYGEQSKDLDPEANVYIGRLPVNNRTEIKNVVAKLLAYERSPPSGSWFRNFTSWGGLMDAPNVFDDPETVADDEGYNDYKDNGYKISRKILDHIPANMEIKEYYDYPELAGGNYTPEMDRLNRTAAKTVFDDGNALISFAGQAYYTGDELAHYRNETGTMIDKAAWGTLYSYNNAKFSLNHGMLPLVYLSTCSVNFTEPDDSNMEQFLYAAEGGAIGVIANTGKSYRGESADNNSYGNWWLNERFWKLFFNDSYYRPGEALYVLKYQYHDEVLTQDPQYPIMVYANILGYNLLGDPEVPIWTDIPGELTVEVPNLYTGDQNLHFKVTTQSGLPVEGARICLSNSDNYEFGVTDDEGKVMLSLSSQTTGTVNITATAHNYLPFETTRNINIEPSDLSITAQDLTLGNSTPSEGDKLTVKVMIHNEGNKEAQFFYVECYDGEPDQNGIMVDEPKYIDFIAKLNSELIEFVWNATWGNHTLFVVVDPADTVLESDETNNKASVTFYVNARPKLSKLPHFELKEDFGGVESLELALYTNDEDDNITALQFSIVSITNPNCYVTLTQNSLLELRVASNWFGLAVATVEVTDGLASSRRSFEVKVVPSPDPPILNNMPDHKLKAGDKFVAFARAEDPDGDLLTFSDNTKLFEIDSQSGRIAFTPSENDEGEYTVTITVTDGNLTDHQTINITVMNGGESKLVSTIAIIIAIIIIILIILLYLQQSKNKESEEQEPEAATPKVTKTSKMPPKKLRPVKAPPQKLKLHRSQKSKGKTLKKT